MISRFIPAATHSETTTRQQNDSSAIAERADRPALSQQKSSGRQLRNRLLLVNALVWIALVIMIRALFF